MKFYFPLGLMTAYKLLRVVFQTGHVWETENLSSSCILLYIYFFSCFTWPFPMVFEVFRRRRGGGGRRVGTSSINNVFVLKIKKSWCQQNCLQTCGFNFYMLLCTPYVGHKVQDYLDCGNCCKSNSN